MSQPQANMIDRPALSYGLFHLHAQPIKLYGTLTTRVDFKGLNMDIGHLRSLRWSQANDPAAWVSYNRLRGQQASALEHATPEAFWVDRKQCRYTDENGQTVNPTLADCPQAVSAVKAIAIAASQGQKIYTLTQKNAAAALPQLTVSRTVAAEIKNALAAGKEVTVHEKAINAHGFSGVGYIIVDPDTGSGAYLIEGGGSGAVAFIIGVIIGSMLIMLVEFSVQVTMTLPPALWAPFELVIVMALVALLAAGAGFLIGKSDLEIGCFVQGIVWSTFIAGAGFLAVIASKIVQWVTLALGASVTIFNKTAATQVEGCLIDRP